MEVSHREGCSDLSDSYHRQQVNEDNPYPHMKRFHHIIICTINRQLHDPPRTLNILGHIVCYHVSKVFANERSHHMCAWVCVCVCVCVHVYVRVYVLSGCISPYHLYRRLFTNVKHVFERLNRMSNG